LAEESIGAHWRHRTNTIEPSVCGSDAALCQITLTICYYLNRRDNEGGKIKKNRKTEKGNASSEWII